MARTLENLQAVRYWSDGQWCLLHESTGWVIGFERGEDADWALKTSLKHYEQAELIPYADVPERMRRYEE